MLAQQSYGARLGPLVAHFLVEGDARADIEAIETALQDAVALEDGVRRRYHDLRDK